jgi:integrase
MATTQPIREKEQIEKLIQYYLVKGQHRNFLLIIMSLYTALRISDTLRLRWNDVYDFARNKVRVSISLTEKKTGKPKTIALNDVILDALPICVSMIKANPEDFLFESRKTKVAISRIQAYRIIRDAAEALGMERTSCHSLRKTFGYHAWKFGIHLTVIMEIYNHSSYAVTKRYLGITQDDKNVAYKSLQLYPTKQKTKKKKKSRMNR